MNAKPKPEKQAKSKRKFSKSERKTLEARLWKLTADYVKLRDGCCVTCGATEGLTISHWIKAGKQVVRYDIRNCNCQCSVCNNNHNYNPYVYDNYMLKHWGEKIMIELTDAAKLYNSKNFKWSVLELRGMVEQAEYRLEDLRDNGSMSRLR